jgi:hypothetical protein
MRHMHPDKLVDRVLIWRARKSYPDLSIPALAQLIRKPISTVRHAVKLLEVPPREVLQAYEHQAVSAWQAAIPIASQKGDHRPAKDLLLHTRAIDPVQLQGQTQIAIIFAGAEIPGLERSPSQGDCIDVNVKQIEQTDGNVLPVCSENRKPSESEHPVGPVGGSG